MSIQPKSGQQSTIARELQITIPDGDTWFVIENATDRVDNLLYDELAWEDPDAKYKDAYQRGEWDGYNRLYKPSDHMAPIGLLDRATTILEDHGYTVSVTIEGNSSGDPITTTWEFSHPLRDYQRDAVLNALENDGGMIALPTGAGKTVVAMKLIETLEERTIVFVHTQELLYQWAERLEETLGVNVGMIGDGNWSEGEVTVATMQTLNERGPDALEADYGVGVFDEAHVTSAADVFWEIGLNIDLGWRFGLSATPWRSVDGEELEIEAAIGGVAANIDAERLIDEGYLAEPNFEFIEPEDARTARSHESYHDVVKRCLELAPNRNMAIARKASELADRGHTVLVTVNRIAQGQLLEYALGKERDGEEVLDVVVDSDDDQDERRLKERTVDEMEQVGTQTVAFMQGRDSTTKRQETLQEFENGDLDVLISTVLKEGADIPSISAIVLAEGGKSKVEKIQRIGRALRPKADNHAVIADVSDDGEYLRDHYETRVANYKEYYGQYGPESGFTEREEAVRTYLDDHDVPLDACQVTETESGTVTIELTDYLGGDEFDSFQSLMQQATGVTYDGSKNRCSPSWIDQISTA